MPGGIVNPSESPRDGAVREIQEELALDLDVERVEDGGEDLAAGELGLSATTRLGLEVGAVATQLLEIVRSTDHGNRVTSVG